ncbi:uncharacterized protein EAE97_003384 [Botrytis byssoidea]|uniref:Uncharacterized protein n=1 Tax=Botrytis byssoidea TaxID=139641 RepID=A0A9P5ITV3_9HELO|nr:uncharacterized protein EAE97_003384 [Botrytis byssoidea]KAF7949875.1 hypothetical protein EAE97_003384 [Botrytis byssoidea]
MSSGSPSPRNPIDNEGGKRKHRGSSSVASRNSNSNSKKRERTQPPKDRARTEGGRSSTNRSSSRDSRKSSERSQWSSDGELPENVMSATDLALYRNRENRQPLNDSPPPPHSPPRLQKKKSLDSFPSLSETQSEKIETEIKHIRMKIGWLNPNSSADRQTIAEYDHQIRELGRQLRPLRRG